MTDRIDTPLATALRAELEDLHVEGPPFEQVRADADRPTGPPVTAQVVFVAAAAALLAVASAAVLVSSTPAPPALVLAGRDADVSSPLTADQLHGRAFVSVGDLPGAPDPRGTLRLSFMPPLDPEEYQMQGGGDALLAAGTDPGCNGVGGGPVVVEADGRLRQVNTPLSTLMGCAGVRIEMDEWASALLREGPRLVRVSDHELRLERRDGTSITLLEDPVRQQLPLDGPTTVPTPTEQPGHSEVPSTTPPPSTSSEGAATSSAPIADRPPASMPHAAEVTGHDGQQLAATLVAGHVLGEPGGVGTAVMGLQGSLWLPPEGVRLSRWEAGAWVPVPHSPSGGNAYAGIGLRRPFTIGVWPPEDGSFLPGWYELQLDLVQDVAGDRPTVMTLAGTVLVPPAGADLSVLADDLPVGAAGGDGDVVVELQVTDEGLVIRNSGTADLPLPAVRVAGYLDQLWRDMRDVPTGVEVLPAGESVTLALDPLLDGYDAIKIQVDGPEPAGTAEPLVAIEYVGPATGR
jgi:hypothetical protein